MVKKTFKHPQHIYSYLFYLLPNYTVCYNLYKDSILKVFCGQAKSGKAKDREVKGGN